MKRLKMSSFVVLAAIALLACKKTDTCAKCHMTIDPSSPHTTEIEWADGSRSRFDSVVCAVTLWQNPRGPKPKKMTVHEYYTSDPRDAADVLFVRGSDVTSAMGDDFVAVDPANAKKFETDHGGKDQRLGDIVLDPLQKDGT